MTDTRTPAELLTAAADRLESLLDGVTPGPWCDDGPYWQYANDGTEEETALATTRGRKPVLLAVPSWARNAPNSQRAHANVRYAGAMNPTVGRALVALFRRGAWMVRLDSDLARRIPMDEVIATARAILGEAS